MATAIGHRSNVILSNGLGLRPPLKWAGGKRWLVPKLKSIWERHSKRRLVEPFCGGLAVALGLLPYSALLNDINPHAINFYRWLKRGLRRRIEMENREDMYYKYRTRFNVLISQGIESSSEVAEIFYYLNRTGYNGLCRFNRQGEFNVPFGKYATINYATDFLEYRDVFARWEFTVGDFENVTVEKSDLIYADPPYDVEFTQYAKEGFSWEDQERLAVWLSKHRGPVILSNQATDRILKLYESLGFHTRLITAPRMISCTGNRSKVQEVLATKRV
ncbi:MAG TPA: Dam family site-specific DNA-(adenine-N6)-methyltransferase [Candidatus Obscuribacterales bacterium]